ncbi:MAG: PRC-barrel domain containing protein [Candidatus Omnitrophica bacterium]|nr:PRC-barrel domain containing protein [Candidatus Omnitrophota bacterium]MCA9426938.1 PRC-barrel domain containing protein [Candidatus Omnitrophota bacterium]MCA9439811.1 PRC-barrel domain containing protein [Candidatus Omnitrophota bacterium]MCA9446995.1 PRC-barrel domain containing protein [Candidatus Omnitrophota bacterium]MCB9767702.1 PRC-barrel domain containing protein [Candidatus Omnitrophota bacterium]
MLRSLNHLFEYEIAALDGTIGSVYDYYFDDKDWKVRYIALDTGNWLPGKRVLVTPDVVWKADWSNHQLHVNLTIDQIENSPSIESKQTVSEKRIKENAGALPWPYFYGDPIGGAYPAAVILPPLESTVIADDPEKAPAEPECHLRGVREVENYHIEATDGEIGHLEDFIADDETWTIRYLVVNTANWISGKKVLIDPEWADYFNWADSVVRLDLSREEIKNSPEYEPDLPVNREFETRLYDFYGRPKYWL